MGRISLCMIVRDEMDMLPACLASLKQVVDETVIVDTGSTDGTDAWAESRADVFVRFAWCDDFAAARNAGLEHATGDWILVVDADERLTDGAQGLRQACANPDALAWKICVSDSNGSAWMTRLFRRRADVRYRGRIHEQVTQDLVSLGARVSCLHGVRFEHLGYDPEIFAKRGKRERNVRLLQQEIAEHPNDPYLHYKLHQALGGDSRSLERAGELTLELSPNQLAAFAIGDELLCAVSGHWLSSGRAELAKKACESALRWFAPHPALLTHLGSALSQLGELADALAVYKRAWSMHNGSVGFSVDVRAMRIHLAREYAQALNASGDRASAVAVLEQLKRELTTDREARAI